MLVRDPRRDGAAAPQRRCARRLAFIVAALLAVPIAPARAGGEEFLVDPVAQKYYERAGVRAARGDLRAAVTDLDAAFAVEPHPELLFVRAELRRQLGECQQASRLYRAFLESTPSEEAVKQANAGLALCEPQPRVEAPAPSPEVAKPTPSPAPKPAPAARRPWYRDSLAGALLGCGAAGLVATTGLVFGVITENAAANVSTRHSELDRHHRRSVAYKWAAAATGVVSVGLLTGSVIRYRRVARREVGLALSFGGGGFGLTASGRF